MFSEAKDTLRSQRALDDDNILPPEGIEPLVRTLDDFLVVIQSARAGQVVPVATSFLREAENGAAVLAELHARTGLSIRLLTDEEEAQFTFHGAVWGLPVDNGLAVDIGGGSAELALFERRTLVDSWTLLLGSLHLSDLFLRSDPPTRNELHELKEHIRSVLQGVEIRCLGPTHRLIGTGGSIRNIAKIDRRTRSYRFGRLHGYTLEADQLRAICKRLAHASTAERLEIGGLNDNRVDSIVGGAFVLRTLVEYLSVPSVLVSGHGIREGLARGGCEKSLPEVEAVRRGSIICLAERFAAWDRRTAERRAAVTVQLVDKLRSMLDADSYPLIEHAVRLVDAGSSMDYYNRFANAALIVERGDVDGFDHREIALLSAMLRYAERERRSLERYEPILGEQDRLFVRRAGTLIALVDELERRLTVEDRGCLSFYVDPGYMKVNGHGLSSWQPRGLAKRFESSFGLELVVGGEQRT